MSEDMQQQLMEFEKNRAQLSSIASQKQQLQFQANALSQSLEELKKTKEKKVFKVVGNILVQADTLQAKKELEEKKESTDLRIKSMQKQEDSVMNKLNKLKVVIEKEQKEMASKASREPDTVTETESDSDSEETPSTA